MKNTCISVRAKSEILACMTVEQKRKYLEKKEFSRSSEIDYVAGRFLLDDLMESLSLPKQKVQNNSNGAPFLNDNFFCSISHSQNTVAVAISLQSPIGIDVEEIINDDDVSSLAEIILQKNEAIEVSRDYVTAAFCIKESIYKQLSTLELEFRSIQIVKLDLFNEFFEANVLDRQIVKGTIKKIDNETMLSIAKGNHPDN